MLHGEAGAPAWAGRGGSRWEHRQPTRRAGSVLPSSVCLVTVGSGFQAVARPLVGIPGIRGWGGRGQREKPRQSETGLTESGADPELSLPPSAFASMLWAALGLLPPGSLP